MSVAYSDADFVAVRRPPRPSPIVDSITEPVSFYEWQKPAKPAEPPTWISSVIVRMVDLMQLQPNWDGRGSAAVKTDVLKFAHGMLSAVMAPSTPAPSIVPLGNGGVQLAWSSDKGELEVEITAPPEILIYHFDRAKGLEKEWPADTVYSDLELLLKTEFTS